MGLTNVTSINEIRCFLYLCIRSITFNIIPSKMFGISIMFSISELHLYFSLFLPLLYLYLHMILQKCRHATVLAAGDNQRKGKKSREREEGVGGSRHSSFIRSLFVIYFVHNLVDYNGTLQRISDQFVVVVACV